MDQALQAIWAALNSPIGIAAVAAIVLWAINRIYASKPDWKAYEGTIIQAIKFAEAKIPDDTSKPGLARFDYALKYILKIYEANQGKPAPASLVASLREGISLVHNDLESKGTL